MIRFITSAKDTSGYPSSKREVVFVGRSNVGKSSLINALYGNVAYVGKTPGKTKLLNFFDVDGSYTICDVPGYGYAEISDREIIEFGDMMEEYFEKRSELKLCVMILDIRRVPNEDDQDMYACLEHYGIPCLFVLNKADKLSNNKINEQIKIIAEKLGISEDNMIPASCLKNKNIGIIRETIVDFLC